jgi:hypothetical protein
MDLRRVVSGVINAMHFAIRMILSRQPDPVHGCAEAGPPKTPRKTPRKTPGKIKQRAKRFINRRSLFAVAGFLDRGREVTGGRSWVTALVIVFAPVARARPGRE